MNQKLTWNEYSWKKTFQIKVTILKNNLIIREVFYAKLIF